MIPLEVLVKNGNYCQKLKGKMESCVVVSVVITDCHETFIKVIRVIKRSSPRVIRVVGRSSPRVDMVVKRLQRVDRVITKS